jgi:hypothetical protein
MGLVGVIGAKPMGSGRCLLVFGLPQGLKIGPNPGHAFYCVVCRSLTGQHPKAGCHEVAVTVWAGHDSSVRTS